MQKYSYDTIPVSGEQIVVVKDSILFPSQTIFSDARASFLPGFHNNDGKNLLA